jgi:uncharacterized phage protein (TIGR02220 family)
LSSSQGSLDLASGSGAQEKPRHKRRKRSLSAKYREQEPTIRRVLGVLRKRTGTAYQVCDGHAKVLAARIRDDQATEADLRLVVWDRCNRWLGTEQEEYLRPSTLFRPGHWPEYLAQAQKAWRDRFGDAPPQFDDEIEDEEESDVG